MNIKRGQVLSLTEIMSANLPDSPCLIVHGSPVQTSHITEDEFLQSEGWAGSEWVYVRTTNEWVPVFKAKDTEAVSQLVIIEQDNDCADALWITPKAYPREQYVWSY